MKPTRLKLKKPEPKELRDKINIIDFCRDPNLLNLNLLDTQEVILRAAYGLPMTKDQRQTLRKIVGSGYELNYDEGYEFSEVILVLGARSGKSTLVSAISAYESSCREWHKFLRPGELAWCFVFATREQQAIDLGKNMISSNIKSSPILRGLVVNTVDEATRSLFPRSKAGVLVMKTGMAICALPCSSKVGRGYPVGVAVFDEMAFYARESKNESTDKGIYDSIIPRQVQFVEPGTDNLVAKTFMITTPADRTGLIWERYRDRLKYKNRKLYFCIRAPTWRIRVDFSKKVMDRFKSLSGFGYNREFGAEFADALSPYIARNILTPCIRPDDEQPLPIDKESMYYIGIDAAFGDRDRFGIAVGHAEEYTSTDYGEERETFRIVIDVAEKLEADYDRDITETALKRILELCETYDTWEVLADQHQADSFGKLLEAEGVYANIRPWTTALHRKLYGQLRSLLLRKGISFPNNVDLIDEILGLQIKYLSASGQYTISHRAAGHDDISDAVALVIGELWIDEESTVEVQVLNT